MKCSNCQAEIPEASQFCLKCGKPQGTKSSEALKQALSGIPLTEDPIEPAKPDQQKKVVVTPTEKVLYVGVTLFVILFVISFIGPNSETENKPSRTPLISKRAEDVAPPSRLPDHQVTSMTSLFPKKGNRVEIHSQNENLSRDECVALIEAYRDRGAPEGQVSVHKPSKKLGGSIAPWCVENFDGKGIRFNSELFAN